MHRNPHRHHLPPVNFYPHHPRRKPKPLQLDSARYYGTHFAIQLAGFTDGQLDRMEKTGQWIQPHLIPTKK